MRSRVLPALTAALLAFTLVPATAAADRETPGPALPPQASETAAERAETALARAQALFADHSHAAAGGREATMVLNELVRLRDELTGAQRARADRLLARPTSPGGDGAANYTVREAKPHCGGVICVHYVRRTADAPRRADSDGDRVPNAVEATLEYARHVHRTYVDSGYRRPDSDGRRGGRRGKVDIYLADLGAGFYGYCTTDPQETGSHVAAYCTIDDDFARWQFPTNTPSENRKVTLAHEYFHAVQFAYDFYEDGWFMEATATWVEDEVYDAINDSRQYLFAGQLGSPRVPLDRFGGGPHGLNHYGNWIFFRHLTERWQAATGSLPNLVLDMWMAASARLGAPNMSSTQAVEAVLTDRGSSFTSAYGDFAVDNRDPALEYEEGAAYEPFVASPPVHTLSPSTTSVEGTPQLDHLTSFPVRFQPEDLPPGSQLTLDVGLPAARPDLTARLVVHHVNGTTTQPPMTETPDGDLTALIPLTAEVNDVELVVVNASRRTIHDNSNTTYRATVTGS